MSGILSDVTEGYNMLIVNPCTKSTKHLTNTHVKQSKDHPCCKEIRWIPDSVGRYTLEVCLLKKGAAHFFHVLTTCTKACSTHRVLAFATIYFGTHVFTPTLEAQFIFVMIKSVS